MTCRRSFLLFILELTVGSCVSFSSALNTGKRLYNLDGVERCLCQQVRRQSGLDSSASANKVDVMAQAQFANAEMVIPRGTCGFQDACKRSNLNVGHDLLDSSQPIVALYFCTEWELTQAQKLACDAGGLQIPLGKHFLPELCRWVRFQLI